MASQDSVRLFVAVYPPVELAAGLVVALDGLRLAEHRVTPVSQIHMTLQFIGDTRERELDSVVESVERSAAGLSPFSLRAERLITLPRAGEGRRGQGPRLVAALFDSPPPLLEMQRRLASRLARKPRERAGEGFTPHMTLCRFREGAGATAVDAAVEAGPGWGFGVGAIRLMRSVLRPSGAEHALVREVVLSG